MTEASPVLHRRRRPRDTTSLSLDDSQHESPSQPTEPSPMCLVPFLIGDRLFHVSTLSLQQDPSSRLAHMAAVYVQLRILLAGMSREWAQHGGGHDDEKLSVPDRFCVHDTVLVRLPPKRRMRTSPTDCTNPQFAVFVDRDPDSFRRLMLLQGYHAAVSLLLMR